MNTFSQEQKDELSVYLKTIQTDEIVPLPRSTNSKDERILPIIRGSQSLFMPFPKKIERDITFSFETQGEIPYGTLRVQMSGKKSARVMFYLTYSKDWYWTIAVDKKTPITMSSEDTEKVVMIKKGKHRVSVRAFDRETNREIAYQTQRVVNK